MSRDEASAVAALKNAWLGVVTSAAAVTDLSPSVQGLPDDAPIASLDFETYHRVVGAHANAVMALRGLLDEVKRKSS
jgi:hypothetical protein